MAVNVKKKANIGKFLKEVIVELKKVTWPTKNQLIKQTITVIVACFVIGIIIWISDIAFNAIATAFYSILE